MTAPSHIAPQLTLCLAITRRLRAYLLNQLAPACSGSSHSDKGVSGRETFGKEGLIFRQNCELLLDCSFRQKVRKSANLTLPR